MGHLGRLLRALGAALSDLEASWWRLGPLKPRLTPQGVGGVFRARARAGLSRNLIITIIIAIAIAIAIAIIVIVIMRRTCAPACFPSMPRRPGAARRPQARHPALAPVGRGALVPGPAGIGGAAFCCSERP